MRHPFLTPTVAMIIALGVLPLAAQSVPAAAVVAPTPQLAYQGHLLEAGVAANGARVFVFSLRDATGLELWSSGNQTVTVSDGLYSVVLGSTGMPAISPPVLAQSGLKLHVVIGGVAMAPDVELIPAFQSRSAWELVGAFSGDVTGTQTQSIVSHLQGIPVDLTTVKPTTGQGLLFDGTKFVPSTVLGTAGPQGPVGATGPQGAKGDTGATGAQGLQGVQGVQGFAGATGAAGAAGANGKTLLNGAGAPTASGAAGTAGDFYLDTTNNLLFGPKAGDSWVGLKGLSLVGPQGPTGPTGPTGAQGPQGVQGFTGATGAQGAQGSAGASPFTLTGSDAVYTAGRVGIGTAPTSASALLELGSTTQGLLAPRMTAAQRTAIGAPGAPATGLLVFQTDSTAGFYYYNGSAWAGPLASSSANGTVTSVSGTTNRVSVSNGTSTPVVNIDAAYAGQTSITTLGTIITGTVPVALLSGTLPLGSGGTGQSTQQAAINALTGTQTGGYYLRSNGTNAVLSAIQAADVPTLNQSTTGTAANVTGTVAVANGGTGVTSLTANKVLVGNGSSSVIQPTNLHWDNTNARLGIGTTAPTERLHVADSGTWAKLKIENTGSTNATLVELGKTGKIWQFGTDHHQGNGDNFYIWQGSSGIMRFVLDTNGSLGLGGNYAPNASALVDMTSTTQGFLPPRMTLSDRNAIASPATGLVVYQTDNTAGLYTYSGAAWLPVTPSGGSGTVTSVAALTLTSSGTDLSSTVATGTSTPVITLNVPTASAANRGALSATDWSTFNAKAPLVSPAFTGTPTAPTAAGGTNSTQVATTAYADAAAATAASSRAAKGANSDITSLSSLTTALSVGQGGTGATSLSGYGVLVANSDGSAVTTVAPGTKGKVLVSTGTVWMSGRPLDSDTNNNTAAGSLSLAALTTGSANTGFGYFALNSASTATYNSAFGLLALNAVTSGQSNVAVGYEAGKWITTGKGNVFLGANAGGTAVSGIGTTDNQVAIGWGATTTKANQMVVGSDGAGWPALTEVVSGAHLYTDLGSTGNRWKDLYARNVDVTGSFTVNGSPITGGSGTVTSVAALTLTSTSATDLSSTVATGTSTPAITLNVPTASASNRGALSAADWSTFNAKAPLVSPAFTGTPTAPTASGGTNSTQVATTAYADSAAATAASYRAAKGANSDITSLSGLTTALSAGQGGTGLSTYAKGDVLYHDGTQFQKLTAGSTSSMLIMGPGGVPVWSVTGAGAITGNIWTMLQDSAVLSAGTETTWITSSMGQGSLTIPAGAWTAGKTLRVRLGGTATTSGNPTCNLYLRMTGGGTTVKIADTTSVSTSTGGWTAEFTVTCRSTSAASNFASISNMLQTQSSSLGGKTSTLTATVSNLNANNQTLDISGLCASTSLTATICTVEILN